jgi:group I intron endonuclease
MPIVYLATNTVNGHRYVGKTVGSLANRRSNHIYRANCGQGYRLHAALRKYGPDAFEWSVVATFETERQAYDAEVAWIAELRPEYNVTAGGEGATGLTLSEDARHRIGLARTGKRRTPEQMEKMRARLAAQKKAPSKPRRPYRGERQTRQRRQWGTKASRERARNQAMAQLPEWEKYRPLGPAASSRAVVCLDDGKEYPSASAAARAYGASKSAVVELCNGRHPHRRTAAGRRFAYAIPTAEELNRLAARDEAGRRQKLTTDDVAQIRELLPQKTLAAIGRQFGVDLQTIRDIKRGITWKVGGANGLPA